MKNTFFYRITLVFTVLALCVPQIANAQWVPANGGLAGAYVLGALGASGSDLFASTTYGVFHSTNNGTSWVTANTGLIDSGNVDGFATSSTSVFAASNHGVYRSDNNGVSWTKIAFNDTGVTSFAVIGNNLFAATDYYGVFLSNDNGSNWTAVNTGLYQTSLYPGVWALGVSGTSLFASTASQVYVTTNLGTSWISVDSGLTSVPINAFASIGSTVFAGSYVNGTNLGGVFLSTNDGSRWIEANNGLPPNTSVDAFAVIGSNLFAGTSEGIFLSTDSGVNWVSANNGFPNITVRTLAVIGSSLFAGDGSGGIYLSSDSGASWIAINTGARYVGEQVASLATSGRNLFAALFSPAGVFLSTNDGSSWTVASTGLTPDDAQSLEMIGTDLFASVRGNGVFRSTNNGSSWIRANTGLTDSNLVYGFVTIGTNLFAGTSDSVFLSSDSGMHWKAASSGIPGNGSAIDALAVIGSNLLAGTYNNSNGGVFLSTDNGTNWTPENTGLTNVYVQALAASGANLFAATQGGVFRSTDSGKSWAITGLTNPSIQVFAVDGNNLFAAGYGIFLSNDKGKDWTEVDSGITNIYVSGDPIIALSICDSNLFTGDQSTGVWRRPLSEMITTSSVAQTVPTLSEIQSYPNPFTQSTTISFTSPETGVAEVTIVNLLGSQVARLFEGELAAGEHTFTWNAANMPPGAYWAIVRMNGASQQIPIVLQP